jgi:hypothetical protein
MSFAATIVTAICLLFGLAYLLSSVRLARLRNSGIYPQRGAATDADVQRLLQAGLRKEAIRCHREVHKSSLRQAREAINLQANARQAKSL